MVKTVEHMKKKGNFSKRELKKLGMEDLEDSVNLSMSMKSGPRRGTVMSNAPDSPGIISPAMVSPQKTLELTRLNASV